MRELQKLYGGLGQFSIAKHFLYDSPPGVIQSVMFGLIVVSAEPHWEGDRIIYRAFGPEFKEIEMGMMIPEYDVVIHTDRNDQGIPSYRVEWIPGYKYK